MEFFLAARDEEWRLETITPVIGRIDLIDNSAKIGNDGAI